MKENLFIILIFFFIYFPLKKLLMSRIIVTEKYKLLDLNPSNNSTFLESTIENRPSQPRAVSITRRVKAALAYTTSHDIYYQKLNEVFSVANKQMNLKSYLNEQNKKKINESIKPGYLAHKIDHLVKLAKANENKDEEIFNGINQNNFERKRNLHNKSSSAINDSLYEGSTVNKNFVQDLLIQKKCNQILYSENYIDRLKERYEKNLKKNETLQKLLEKSIKAKWEALLKEKEKKAQKKVGETTKLLNGDEEQIALMQGTKLDFRLKKRMEKVHRKRYMSLWEKNGLPVKGIGYSLKHE